MRNAGRKSNTGRTENRNRRFAQILIVQVGGECVFFCQSACWHTARVFAGVVRQTVNDLVTTLRA